MKYAIALAILFTSVSLPTVTQAQPSISQAEMERDITCRFWETINERGAFVIVFFHADGRYLWSGMRGQRIVEYEGTWTLRNGMISARYGDPGGRPYLAQDYVVTGHNGDLLEVSTRGPRGWSRSMYRRGDAPEYDVRSCQREQRRMRRARQ